MKLSNKQVGLLKSDWRVEVIPSIDGDSYLLADKSVLDCDCNILHTHHPDIKHEKDCHCISCKPLMNCDCNYCSGSTDDKNALYHVLNSQNRG